MKDIEVFLLCPFFLMISCDNTVKINDEFTIEYLEMYSSISLSNEDQGFVPNVKEAYWNEDSLVVSGSSGCFLLNLRTIKYNDEMIKIDCNNLDNKIQRGEVKRYRRE